MEHHQKFIDNLIALKSYYQKEIEEYERALKNAREQLEHINALLLDQLEQQHKRSSTTSGQSETVTPAANNAIKEKATSAPAPASPQQLSVPLPESASTEPTSTPFSATPTSPFDSTTTESRQPSVVDSPRQQSPEQLAIPEKPEPVQPSATQELLELAAESITPELSSATTERSLLPNHLPAAPESTVQVRELATPVLTELVAAASAAAPSEESVGTSTDNITGERSLQLVDALANPALTVQEVELPTQKPAASVSEVSEPGTESVADSKNNVASEHNEPQQLELTPPTDNVRSRRIPPLKTPLLPQYQHFITKSEAVEKFLQDNSGKIFSIEEVVRAMHGDLEPEAMRRERLRMYDTLHKGVAKGLWSAVPNMKNYYTIGSQSQAPTAQEPEPLPNSLSKPTTNRSRYSDSMLPRYQQLSFTEAVATVVQEKAGQVLSPEQVTRELYGNLLPKDLTKNQAQIVKALWAGAKKGRWQRVPGQLGQYTWNLSLLNA